ncbi:hypothetical protein NLI96_g1299 [Meripilus lineatus]|uniref:CFEM domain-containing protein n=1 Tax=Meripilus lineatus TaxID=2056292 RepID=A0AAD5YIJ8_9APHY|nr:hypothetical protein NLI96_g1299 [Physisporinus lineatus]
MRFSTVLIALAGIVASTSASRLFARQYPDCANPCIANADIGTCDPSDLGCLCKNEQFIASTTQCIISSCNPEDTIKAEDVAKSFCESVGVTLSGTPTLSPSATPTGSAGSSGSGSASVSRSGSSAATSATAPTSAGASVTSSGTPSPTSSTNAAVANGANTVLGLAAVFGFAAVAL